MLSHGLDRLRHWWWRTSLLIRMIPALAVLALTAASVLHAVPAPPHHQFAQPRADIAPTTTSPPPPPPYTPPAPPPAPPPESTTQPTSSVEPTTETPTTTTEIPRRTTTIPPPTASDDPTTTTTTSDDDWVPVVEEGQPCHEEGAVGRTADGSAASCQPDDDGDLEWTTQW